MNLLPFNATRLSHRSRQTGSAVIVVLALLALMLIYIAANSRTLFSLGRELKLLERQQIHRLETTPARTNFPPSVTIDTNSVPKPGPN